MKIISKITLVLLLFIILPLKAQKSQHLTDDPPLDASIRHGKLKSGLTYYIKDLPKAKSEIQLRLLVKAGVNNQDKDQLNIAHFLEHMAFKSSEHFPNGIHFYLDNFLKGNITKFNINGTTGTDKTIYKFNAPANSNPTLETGLLWFKDIAQGLRLTTTDIDEERGVLIQEAITRSSDNAGKVLNTNMIMSRLVPCNQDYSNFFKHHKYFKPEIVRRFYRDWYKPELMAIVAVGNINDLDSLETKIKTSFADINPSLNKTKSPHCDSIYFNSEPHFVNVEKVPDGISEIDKVDIEMLYRDPVSSKNNHNFNGVMRGRKLSIFIDILNNRLRERTNKYNNFYKIRTEHTIRKAQNPSAIRVIIQSENNQEKEAIINTVSTVSQLNKKGVLMSEFEKIKNQHLDNLDNLQNGQISFWLSGIEEHFIDGKLFTRDQIEQEKKWLADFTINEFNSFLKSLPLEMPEDIGIAAPPVHKALSFTENKVRTWIKETYQKPVSPYSPSVIPEFIMDSNEVKQLGENQYMEIKISNRQVREFKLKNGLSLVLHSFEPSAGPHQKKILLKGFNSNGALNVPDEDYFSAIHAPGIIKNSGIGSLNKFEFQRYTSGNSLWWYGIKPYIKNQETGIEINGKPEDLEAMLQVVYLLFTNPNTSKEAFEDWKLNERKRYENQHGDLKYEDLTNNIKKIINDYSGASFGTEQFKGIEKINIQKVLSIYKQLYNNANDFTFILTGNFSIEKYLPVINKYLGNLPTREKVQTEDKYIRAYGNLPIGPVYTEFYFPENYKKENSMYIPQHLIRVQEADWNEKLKVEALGAVIDNLVWNLRFDKGYSIYTTGAGGSYNETSRLYKLNNSALKVQRFINTGD
ncbi:M16 family metallopeptidase [Salegentibacter maritimus]|uniref:M16 family metallopeptidase n=1 Tax=Salegentibacter maritimus TaxID=2794347 RepID=UPI0018E49735|nr:insulinase family protein [Salegentibacter maritimus]MBI6116836.1 insulinase family protein [Salegentibacter maritimus]